MAEAGSMWVTIAPKLEGGFGGKVADGIGKAFGAVTKGIGVAVAAATGLVVGVTKSFADLEQAIGGVETMFESNAAMVISNSETAYKRAGVNATTYMEQLTSFSARLLQGLGGDTAEAARIADLAMVDMADNANKFGTDIGSIQNAYQGFAKDNYTMLDNLKLGYGGTKKEMQRLLDDAEKMPEAMGRKFNLDNYADMIEAINVVQQNMGVAGTTMLEAEETISGSINMLQASFQDLVAGLGNPAADVAQLATNVVDSFQAVVPNVVKVVNNITDVLPEALQALAPAIVDAVAELLPGILEAATGLIDGLVGGIIDAAPSLVEAAVPLLMSLVNGLTGQVAPLVAAAAEIVTILALGVAEALPELVPAAINMVVEIVQTLLDSLPMILDAGIQLLLALVDGLVEALPNLVEQLGTIVETIIVFVLDAVPELIIAATTLFTALIRAIDLILPPLIATLPKILVTLVTQLIKFIPELILAAVDLLFAIIKAIPLIVPELILAIPLLIVAIVDEFKNAGPRMLEAGKDVIRGFIDGIKSMAGDLISSIKSTVTDALPSFVRKALGIASPSKVFAQLGEMVGLGFEEGLTDSLNKAVDLGVSLVDGFERDTLSVGFGSAHMIGQPVSIADLDRLAARIERACERASTGVLDAWVRSQLGGRQSLFDSASGRGLK